jgi:hypothetical protein
MKKITALFVFCTLTIATFFVACKKENNTLSVQEYSYNNPNNPYDLIGVKHNESLQILHENNPANNMNADQSFRVLAEHGYEKLDFKNYATDFATLWGSKEPLKAIASLKYKKGVLSENLYQALLSLNDIVHQHAYTQQLAPAVISFENTINGLQLSENETRTLYYATSIARYSNEYWMNYTSNNDRDITRKDYVMLCDVAGAVGAASSGGGILVAGEAAAVASELGGVVWDFVNGMVIPNPGGPISWGWGGGIFGPPCAPGYACPCSIEFNPNAYSSEFSMAGFGTAVGDSAVMMVMDGQALDPGFEQIFSTGTYQQQFDFTMPQDIVNGVYAAAGLPAPQEPGISPAGPKEVVASEGAYSLILPIIYPGFTRIYIIIIII